MKTTIIYATQHGTTEKVARMIAEGLNNGPVELVNIREQKNVASVLASSGQVVIGGSVHAGKLSPVITEFMTKHLHELLTKKIALFQCCMNEPEADSQFNAGFPELLREHAVIGINAGGEYLFERMNFMERFLVRKIAGAKSSLSALKHEEIRKLIEQLQTANTYPIQ